MLEPDVIARLMAAMKQVPHAAACHPEIRDARDPALSVHYNGGWVHYLCGLVPRSENGAERPDYEIFDVVSGGTLLVDRRVALHIGGLDEDLFFKWEDTEWVSRFTLAGYRCLNVPAAVVHHLSSPRGTSQVFFMVRNRWIFMLKLYSWRTLILAAPMLLLFEISQAMLLALKGAGKDYWRANLAVLSQLPSILRKRRAFQKLKTRRDRHWLRGGDFYVADEFVQGKSLRALKTAYCSFSDLYWRAIRPFC